MSNFLSLRARPRSQARPGFARAEKTQGRRGIRSRGARFALTLLLAGVCAVRSVSADVLEDELKAAFLYKILGFVSWPSGTLSSDDDSLRVCFLEQHPFVKLFASRVEGKQAAGHLVTVDWLKAGASPQSCHVLFIRASEFREVGELLDQITSASILTIGDADDFAAGGGVVGFRRASNRLRFEVNLRAAHRANLVISAQLLEIATVLTGRIE